VSEDIQPDALIMHADEYAAVKKVAAMLGFPDAGGTVLEHAAAALAGDNEGVRLWMLDCGELVERHRARAAAAEAQLAEVREVIATFFAYHGNNTAASLTAARDLAEGIRQVLDRVPLGGATGQEP